MLRNYGGQILTVFAFDSTTNLPKTGDGANITCFVSKDDGAHTALSDVTAVEISSTNAAGYYRFGLDQAETDAYKLHFTAKSTTANIVVLGCPAVVYTKYPSVRRNTAFPNFHFMMTDSTNHAPATGKTVSVTRAIDSDTFASGTLSAVTEIASGMYRVDFAAADLNGRVVTLRATASGCDDRDITLLTTD